MDILIDVGGSSIEIKPVMRGVLSSQTKSVKTKSREEFYQQIAQVIQAENPSERVEGIAISLSGEYDYEHETVVSCFWNPYLADGQATDKLVDDLKHRFDCEDVYIVNDGDAHALAYKEFYAQKGQKLGGAVNLSLGTSVGFGLLDRQGNLLHNCEGHNWEIGPMQLETDASDKHLYSALGDPGLSELERRHGTPNCYIFYGQRLCHFLARDLVSVFHPKFIGLSGGIVSRHLEEIKEGIRRECESRNLCKPGQPLEGVQIDLFPEEDYVMRGLICLLKEKREWKTEFAG